VCTCAAVHVVIAWAVCSHQRASRYNRWTASTYQIFGRHGKSFAVLYSV